MKFKLTLALLVFGVLSQYAQNNSRLNDNNNIGWLSYNGTFKLDSKFSLHTEYQLRRDNYIDDKQQSLLRLGVNYQINPKLQFQLRNTSNSSQ